MIFVFSTWALQVSTSIGADAKAARYRASEFVSRVRPSVHFGGDVTEGADHTITALRQ